jgi:uncharacterized membrane protein YbhN (UPF0104 family)
LPPTEDAEAMSESETSQPIDRHSTPKDGVGPDGTDPASAAAPPSRRSALIRTGFIVAVLFVVFGIILPRYVDYQEVLEAFQDLTPPQIVLMTVLGTISWFVSGLLFVALIAGLSALRGVTAYLILTGIGASVPFGPWNMGVVWVVVRGWGIANHPATSGIALYGVVNQLGRLALPLIAVALLAVTGQLASNGGTATIIALISIVVFIVAVGLIISIVRSDRIADWLGRTGQRLVSWVMARLGRTGSPDVSGSIHRFRDQLGTVIRQRGALAMLVSVLGQCVGCIMLIVALRMCGVPERALAPAEVFAVFALVSVITIIPLSPGGAGVPELLFIAGLSSIAGASYESAITAGVFLYRLYSWFLPIPLAWILLKVTRRGRSILPTTAELRADARGEPA